MRNRFYYLTFILFSFCYNVIAQNDNNSEGIVKNAIYANGDISVILYNSVTLNYNRSIKQSESGFFKNYYLNLGTGYFDNNDGFRAGPTSEGIIGRVGLLGLTGKHRSHFEVGLNALLYNETKINNNEGTNEKEKTFLVPEATLGYRYQKENGIIFRTGLGFPQGLYVGLGYSF